MNNPEDQINKILAESKAGQTEQISSDRLKLEQLIQKNINLSQRVLDLTIYIKKYIFFQKIFGWIKFVVIMIPIILGILYLLPFFQSMAGEFQNLSDLLKQLHSIQGV